MAIVILSMMTVSIQSEIKFLLIGLCPYNFIPHLCKSSKKWPRYRGKTNKPSNQNLHFPQQTYGYDVRLIHHHHYHRSISRRFITVITIGKHAIVQLRLAGLLVSTLISWSFLAWLLHKMRCQMNVQSPSKTTFI